MILSVISEYISIDKLQKENENNYVHFLSRPVDFLGNLSNWGSVIYTTKSIARVIIIRHPGTLHLFRIIECNQPFDIKLVDGSSCRVTMFENSGLAENLAIYFKGDNSTALYTGCFTRCRALLWNKLLHQYVLKGIDAMYVDNTATRSLDPVSVYSASAEILQIAKKYPDHQIIMSVPPFGYEDLIFSLANTAKMKVFVEGAHLFAFEKHGISEIFEQDSQKARVVVKEEEVTLETILNRFIKKKVITLRILLCELPPKNYYENIGLFEVHWSPHPSLFEIYTLINYINPKSVMEIDSMPKLPSFLFVKKESTDTNNSVAFNLHVRGDLSGRSTPVSEIEELSAAEFCNTHSNRQKDKKLVNFQSQFDSFVLNNIARLHNSAWKYYSLPKRIPRRAKRDHRKHTTIESSTSKEGDLLNDFPSVSTFSSLDFSVESKTNQDTSNFRNRKSRENKNAHLISSTPRKGGNDHQTISVIISDKEDSSYDIPSVSTFSSLSSVESNFNLSDQIGGIVSQAKDAPRTDTVQSRHIGDKSPRNKSNKSKEAPQGKSFIVSDKEDLTHDIPSVSTFSSLFSSAENDLNLTGQVNETRDAPGTATAQSRKIDKSVKDRANPKKNIENVKGNQTKSVFHETQGNQSYEFPSVSTFSSLSTSVERSSMWDDLINEAVAQINIRLSQRSQKSLENVKNKQGRQKVLKNGDKSHKNISRDNENDHQAKSDSVVNADKEKEDFSYDIPSVPTFSSLSYATESDSNLRDQINGLVSQKINASSGTIQKGVKSARECAKPIRNTLKKGNQAKVLGTKGGHQSSYEFPSISSSVERNSMWNDLINEVVSQIDISSSQSSEKNPDNAQSNQGDESIQIGDKSITNTSEKNKRDRQDKAVVLLNESQQSHQSSFNIASISTFSSLSSFDGSNVQLDDGTDEVIPQTEATTDFVMATGRAQNPSQKERQGSDNARNKQSEENVWKRSEKRVKKGKNVFQVKKLNQEHESKEDNLSRSTFSSFNQVNEIISQLNKQKPQKIAGTFSGRLQELPQERRQNTETVQNRNFLKKRETRIKGKSKKDERDLEEDAQVVPNVSDGIGSDTSEEFNSSTNLFSEDTLSISTFTSLSLSSLSDEKPTPHKSKKMNKKKKQGRKLSKSWREAKRKSRVATANNHGDYKEAGEKESSKPRSKPRRLRKKRRGKLEKW